MCVSVCVCSLRPLFVALNDEAGVVRALAIRVVGRLAGRNPAYVMPALRRHLMQLLSDMDHLPDSRHREGEPSCPYDTWYIRSTPFQNCLCLFNYQLRTFRDRVQCIILLMMSCTGTMHFF